MSVVVVATELSKRYDNGVEALRGIDLRLKRGEMVGILGASGSGKTTLLRLLNGSLRPSAGTLRVLGKDVASLRGRDLLMTRRRVAVIAQQHSLVPRTSVLHNVLLGRLGRVPLWRALWSAVAPGAAERAAASRVLAQLGLVGVLYQPVDALSGGQQQRVAVARALLQGGELIVADEPVASVDQETAGLILDVLRRLAHEAGLTVVVSLHQRALAQMYCRRVIALNDGMLVYDGPPGDAAWGMAAPADGSLPAAAASRTPVAPAAFAATIAHGV